MIVYNITYMTAHDIREAWLSWLTSSRIPAVLETGLVTAHRLFRLHDQDETDGITYVVQYYLENLEALRTFEARYPTLRNQPVPERFFPGCVAFQTVMSEVE